MAENVLTIKYDKEKLMKKYMGLVYLDDAYETTLLYNRIREKCDVDIGDVKTNLFLHQVIVYGRLGAHAMEVDYLLKVLTDESFTNFDSVAVLNRLSTYFGFLMGVDVYDYYLNLIRSRFPQDKRLQDIQKPLKNKFTQNLHFVDDDYSYTCVLDKLSKGDYRGAMAEIDDKKQEVSDFRVKNLEIAMLLTLRMNDEAKNQLEQLELAGCREVEFYANYYQLARVDNSVVSKVISLIENSDKLKRSYELSVMLASLYVSKNEHKKAIDVLKNIRGIKSQCREVLTILAECYQALEKQKELVQVLRKMAVIYPYETWVRFYLIKETEGMPFDLKNNIYGFEKTVKKELKRHVKAKLKECESFDHIGFEECLFMFKSSEAIGDHSLLKQVIENIYHSRHIEIIFDALISIQTGAVTLQLILQVLIENKYVGEFYILRDCLLTKHKLGLPVLFEENTIDIDRDKKQFLLTCYAQTYSLLYFMGFEVDDIASKLEIILSALAGITLLDDNYLHRAECVVYILCNYLHYQHDYIENSFKYLKKEDRENLLKLLENLKLK